MTDLMMSDMHFFVFGRWKMVFILAAKQSDIHFQRAVSIPSLHLLGWGFFDIHELGMVRIVSTLPFYYFPMIDTV